MVENTDDPGFKMIIRNVDLMCWILKNCVEPYKDCELSEIRDCLMIEGNRVMSLSEEMPDRENGTVRLDTVFIVRLPGGEKAAIYLNIEGQSYRTSFDTLAKRATYYLSRVISMQRIPGSNHPYDDITQSFSVWLDFSRTDGNSIDVYRSVGKRISGEGEPKEMDLTRLVIVSIDGKYGTDRKDFKSLITAIFKSGMPDRDLDSLLKRTYKFAETESIIQGRDMMSMTERAINDARSDALNEGIEKGIGIGEERGIKIGEERGIEKGIGKGIVIAVCGYIRNTGATIDEAFDKLSIPDDIRGKICGEIATRLSE